MNHDYAHCMDYRDDCPMECFRARLTKDLEDRIDLGGLPLTWMHFKGTDECKRKESQHDNRSIKRNSRGSSKDGYEH